MRGRFSNSMIGVAVAAVALSAVIAVSVTDTSAQAPASGAALGQSVYYALGTGATQAVVFQLAGVLYAAYGQKAFLGMFVVSAIGMAALVTLTRIWKGNLLVGAQPA